MSGEVEIIDENLEQEDDDTVEEVASSERVDNESEEPEAEHHLSGMDESDVAEMSMIVAQIEGAEDFNLTFEIVDTSELQEDEQSKEQPKGHQRPLKKASPLHKSDQREIESFLEEGIKEMNDSVVEEVNTSLAETLLSDWGSPTISPKSSTPQPRRTTQRPTSALSKRATLSDPVTRRPSKVLRHTALSTGKRLSSPSVASGILQSARKRQSSTSIEKKHKMPRKRSSSTSDKTKVVSPKQVLKARNL